MGQFRIALRLNEKLELRDIDLTRPESMIAFTPVICVVTLDDTHRKQADRTQWDAELCDETACINCETRVEEQSKKTPQLCINILQNYQGVRRERPSDSMYQSQR